MDKDNQSRNEKELLKGIDHSRMTFCVRCCMPSTNEGEGFDEMGICKACCSSEEKMHINWVEREKELRKILFHYKEKAGDNYDCLVPISGGKDSCFQLHIIKRVYGLKPLAVTFSHSWYSEVGKWNLQNILEKLNVDHIMFTPNREVVNKIARHSLSMIGDTCWHCHAGVGAFPLQVAVKFKIPLLVWGESIAEQSGRTTYKDPAYERYDRDYFTRVSAKFYPDEMTNEELTMKDLFPFHAPTKEEVEKAGIVGIHLGDYIFWDAERQMEFVKKEYGWREWEDGEMDGTYKRYKSNECVMHGMHDFTKYLKRGFGRATDHASQDVRAGIITREEGFELIKKHDGRIPKSLNKYLDLAKMSREEFYDIMANHRNMVLNKKEVRSKRFEQNGPRAM